MFFVPILFSIADSLVENLLSLLFPTSRDVLGVMLEEAKRNGGDGGKTGAGATAGSGGNRHSSDNYSVGGGISMRNVSN